MVVPLVSPVNAVPNRSGNRFSEDANRQRVHLPNFLLSSVLRLAGRAKRDACFSCVATASKVTGKLESLKWSCAPTSNLV